MIRLDAILRFPLLGKNRSATGCAPPGLIIAIVVVFGSPVASLMHNESSVDSPTLGSTVPAVTNRIAGAFVGSETDPRNESPMQYSRTGWLHVAGMTPMVHRPVAPA